MVYIYSTSGSQQSLAYKINACLPVQVRKTDPLPKQLCTSCIEQLNTAYEFSESCIAAEGQLNAQMDGNTLNSKPTQKTPQSNNLLASSSNEGLEDCSYLERNEHNSTDNKGNILNSLYHSINNKSDHNLKNESSRSETGQTNNLKEERNHTVLDKQPALSLFNITSQNDCNEAGNICRANNYSSEREILYPDSRLDNKNKSYVSRAKNDFDNTQCCKKSHYIKEQKQQNNDNTNMKSGMSCPLCVRGTMKLKTCTETESPGMKQENNDWDDTGIETAQNNAEICYESFEDFSNPNKNCNEIHELNNVEFHSCGQVKIERENEPTTTCVICRMNFPTIEQCITHSECHSTENSFQCCICGIPFTSRNAWLSHCNIHIATGATKSHDMLKITNVNDSNGILNIGEECNKPKYVYKCDICVKLFSSEITLQYHHSNFHSGIPICCEICNKYCDTPSEYFDHMKNCHARNDGSSVIHYDNKAEINTDFLKENICFCTCDNCGQQFQNNDLLQEHYKTHIVKCQLCGYFVTEEESLKLHMIMMHPQALPTQSCFKCTACKEIFPTLQQAVTHSMTHSENKEDKEDLQQMHVFAAYQCEYCAKCFVEKPDLKLHYSEHTGKKIYVCKVCKAMFYNSNQVEKHQVVHNTVNVPNPGDEFIIPKLFVCFDCDKTFVEWDMVIQHYKTHNETYKLFNDQPISNISCRDKPIYALQDKTNNGHFLACKTYQMPNSKRVRKGKSYMCSVCGEILTLKSLFDKHFRKHANERPFFCEICGRTFSHKSGLYTHRRMHTGERPYPCDICEKSFRLKHDRDNHRRVHTGERPYKCENCEKAFRTSHDYRQHQLIHTGQRPYLCLTCGKGFRRINGLNVHRRIHTGEKPYGCEACGRHFTQKGDMLKHRKTQHGLI